MINLQLLTVAELQWVNDYHLRVREVVGKALDDQGLYVSLRQGMRCLCSRGMACLRVEERAWLDRECGLLEVG